MKELFENLIPDVVGSLARIEAKLNTQPAAGNVFAKSGVQPPSQFYITQNVKVRVRSVTSQTNEFLTLTANILVDDRLVPVSTRSTTFTNTTNVLVLDLPVQGFLVSVSLQCEVAQFRCQTYATVELLDQNSGYMNTLFSGYLTSPKPLSYPPISIEDPFSGYGFRKRIGFSLGAPLQRATITCPSNRIWKINFANAAPTTSAVAANRSFQLGILDASTTFYQALFFGQLMTASQNAIYAFGLYDSFGTSGTATILLYTVPISFNFVQPTDIIELKILNAQAGDLINNPPDIYCIVEEFLTL